MRDLTQALPDLPVAVVDVEATGLEEHDRVCEVAVVHTTLSRGAVPVVAYRARTRPPVPMSAGASRVTGITDEDLVECPPFAEVLDHVRAAVGDRLPVAYNAPFDHGMLQREGLDLGWPWMDAYILARVDKYGPKKLVQVARARGIVVDAHGAAGDALATALVLPVLMAELYRSVETPYVHDTWGYEDDDEEPEPGPHPWATLGGYLDWQRQTAVDQEAEFCAYLRRKGATGDRPDCPWHELEGEPLPYWPDKQPVAYCGQCGSAVVWRIDKAGQAVREDASGGTHRCAGRAA